MLACCLGTACSCNSPPAETAVREGPSVAAASTAPVEEGDAMPIDQVVDRWLAGDADGAIRRLMQLVQSASPAGTLRISRWTERDAVAMTQDERNRRLPRIWKRGDAINALSRELERRANAAIDARRLADAEQFIRCLRAVAAANSGSDEQVDRFSQLAAQALIRRANALAARLREADQAPSAASPTTQPAASR